jgi:hypothetical protein
MLKTVMMNSKTSGAGTDTPRANSPPCRLMANLIALCYNWWNLYVRFYDEEHHREAITSRPALMQGVARQVHSGGRRTVRVSLLHEKGDVIAKAVTLISSQLQRMQVISDGVLRSAGRWCWPAFCAAGWAASGCLAFRRTLNPCSADDPWPLYSLPPAKIRRPNDGLQPLMPQPFFPFPFLG